MDPSSKIKLVVDEVGGGTEKAKHLKPRTKELVSETAQNQPKTKTFLRGFRRRGRVTDQE